MVGLLSSRPSIRDGLPVGRPSRTLVIGITRHTGQARPVGIYHIDAALVAFTPVERDALPVRRPPRTAVLKPVIRQAGLPRSVSIHNVDLAPRLITVTDELDLAW